MKHLIHVLLLSFILMIVPTHFSNTSSIALTPEEIKAEELRLKEALIRMEIKKEYEAFYLHLHEISAPCHVQDFFQEIMDEAIATKSLPSIAIAQASIETGYGRYNKLQNNIFGIKGHGIRVYTHEVYKGKWYKVRANFQYFPTLMDAFERHSQILERYGARGYNYEHWIDRIRACGYATDPRYGHKVKFVIEKYGLKHLDRIQWLQNQIPVKKQESCNLDYTFFV